MSSAHISQMADSQPRPTSVARLDCEVAKQLQRNLLSILSDFGSLVELEAELVEKDFDHLTVGIFRDVKAARLQSFVDACRDAEPTLRMFGLTIKFDLQRYVVDVVPDTMNGEAPPCRMQL